VVIGLVASLARVAPALLVVRLPNSADSVRPGDLIAGKYRIERLIAEGGMGVIARALHLDLERAVAIKFVRSELSEREDIVARLMLEARAVARMRSEHVARVLDVGRLESGGPYIVMEYLEGKDLWTILHGKGRLARPLAIDYAVQACEALAEAHALGIVHRDIKPENLFLSECPDGAPIVKLLDFGISKQKNLCVDGGITGATTAVGSPHYMAPEQMRAESNIDLRADIWAIGVILYELLSGISPFDAESMPKVCARVIGEQPPRLTEVDGETPKQLDAIVFRCLEKDRARRPSDVAELSAALAPFGTAETPQRAERIARIVAGQGARTGEHLKAPSGRNAGSTGNGTGSNAPTSLMPVAGSLLEMCSPKAKRGRRRSRSVAVVGGVALCAGIAAGVFFVARPPLPTSGGVSPAAAVTMPAVALEPKDKDPIPVLPPEPSADEHVLAEPPASAPVPSRAVSARRASRRAAAGADSSASAAGSRNGSLLRIVTKAAALNRSKASATMVSEEVGSDLAKRDSAAADGNAAKLANPELTRPNAWDPKNFGGRR
jgi:eukaryotic-like serine/threonine-protein kinase